MSRSKRVKKIILLCLLMICFIGAAVLAWLSFSLYRPLLDARQVYQALQSEYGSSISEASKWQQMLANYPNAVGWLKAPDLGIDYPVMQASDNDYYLNHLPDGTQNPVGSVFMDAQNSNDLTDPLTILYGHHVGDGEMFSPLIQYREQDFLQQHPVMYYITAEQVWEIQIFAAHEAGAQADYLWNYSGLQKEEREEWFQELSARAETWLDIPTSDDKLMVLVTCASLRTQAPRCIVYGVVKEMTQ